MMLKNKIDTKLTLYDAFNNIKRRLILERRVLSTMISIITSVLNGWFLA